MTDLEASGARSRATTLGDVLYAGQSGNRLAERDWVVLINLVAAGDQAALRQLFERAHRLVFSLIARLTRSRATADELTVEVFAELWAKARSYSADDGSVLAWLMSQARAKGLDWLARDEALDGDILSPATPLWGAVAQRLSAKSGVHAVFAGPQSWREPDWREVAPGISCKLLATDDERARVSMLVRLAPGTDYPPHTHAGVEELHLLDGELWIDDRKLHAGDYNRAEPGTADKRVWSATGCTCVLITSPGDVLATSEEPG